MVDSANYAQWLRRAQEDLRTASNNIADDPEFLTHAMCYACQQAAEKSFKAFLLFSDKRIPNTHDLRFLLRLCQEVDRNLQELIEDVKGLNEYSIEARYPGDNFEDLTTTNALNAYESAQAINDAIVSRLK